MRLVSKKTSVLWIIGLMLCILLGLHHIVEASEDTFYETWVSGNYSCNNGKLGANANRISYPNYLQVQADTTLNVTISDSKYHILLRELNESGKLIKSADLFQSYEYKVQEDTSQVGVTLYCPSNGKLGYEDYHQLFLSGLVASVCEAGKQEDSQKSDEEIVDDFEIDESEEEKTEQEGVEEVSESINEENTNENKDLFYDTWISANYSSNTGKLGTNANRISYPEYIETSAGDTLHVVISDSKYHVLLREISEAGELLKSSDLKETKEVSLLETTSFVGVTVYCPSNGKITYEEYHQAFLSGLVIQISKEEEESPIEEETGVTITEDINGMSALQFAAKLGAGWNLGNSLLCCNGNVYSKEKESIYTPKYYETLWGNLYTTKEMIQAVKEAGFQTIRIPVTYRNHLDSNYQIEEAWLKRVKEIVDYAREEDLYVIINLHHENWLIADESSQQVACNELMIVWTQIAHYFSNYDEHLIFEGFNEVTNSKGQWDSADAASYGVVNAYNQTFVNAVRSTGGKNQERYLLLNTYAAKATSGVLAGFVLPTDSVKEHLMVSVHVYDGIGNIQTIMERLNTYFVSKGIPVIVGEWGVVNSSSNTSSVRVSYVTKYLAEAGKYGIKCIWWDDGAGSTTSASSVSNYALLNRKQCTWYFPEVVNAIISASN